MHHAHQKGIIHRDLKPSNLLVTIIDGRPIPKVIDFGVAKVLHHGLADQTFHTAANVVIGTLEYVAPEQILSSYLDVDIRADVYSLGVVLYQLLCGHLPLSRERELRGSLDEVARTIREVVPQRPSQRLSRGRKKRSTESNQLNIASRQSISTDLDWIVMKCLEKDRNCRYASVMELISDLECFLQHEPVSARPPSKIYRLNTFVRRHYGKVAVAVLSLVVLIVSLVVSMAGWIREVKAERRAENEAAVHRALANFISTDLFKKMDVLEQQIVGLPPDPNISLISLIDRTSSTINEGRLADQPLVEAALRLTLVKAYLLLGKLEPAAAHARRALEINREMLGPDHTNTIDAIYHLAEVHYSADKVDEAIHCLQNVIDARRRRGESESKQAPPRGNAAHRSSIANRADSGSDQSLGKHR